MRKILLCTTVLLLSACAHDQPTQVSSPLVGLTEGQVTDCLGAPAQKQGAGTKQMWTYHLRNDAVTPPMPNACVVNLEMESGRVAGVHATNMAGNKSNDTDCAAALQRCRR